MSFSKKVLLGSLLGLSATSAFAVDTADLRVIGTIAPAACTPTFAGGGVVDYGLIPSASLSSTSDTTLAARTINFTIQCDAPISIGTSWTDGRAGTSTAVVGAGRALGLGRQDVTNIGYYFVRYAPGSTTGDGNAVDVIYRDSSSGGWAAAPAAGADIAPGVRTHAYSAPGTLVPGAYQSVTGTLNVITTIRPTSLLDLTRTVTLDGLSTMTVRYL